MVTTKHYSFEQFRRLEFTSGPDGEEATQLMRLYRVARALPEPCLLELGTWKGASATMLLQACEENGGRLVSVDVDDYSDIANASAWTFVRSDSRRVDRVLEAAPFLRDGIDFLYIDSLHTREHVEEELTAWYPLMKRGSHIFLDDVDAHPYRQGSRKDNIRGEMRREQVHALVMEFFYANEQDLYLDIMYGTTGLAHFYKLSELGVRARTAVPIVSRETSGTPT